MADPSSTPNETTRTGDAAPKSTGGANAAARKKSAVEFSPETKRVLTDFAARRRDGKNVIVEDRPDEDLRLMASSLKIDFVRAKKFVARERRKDSVILAYQNMQSMNDKQIRQLADDYAKLFRAVLTERSLRAGAAAQYEMDRGPEQAKRGLAGSGAKRKFYNAFSASGEPPETSEVQQAVLQSYGIVDQIEAFAAIDK